MDMIAQPSRQWMKVRKCYRHPPPPDLPLAGEVTGLLAALDCFPAHLSWMLTHTS